MPGSWHRMQFWLYHCLHISGYSAMNAHSVVSCVPRVVGLKSFVRVCSHDFVSESSNVGSFRKVGILFRESYCL